MSTDRGSFTSMATNQPWFTNVITDIAATGNITTVTDIMKWMYVLVAILGIVCNLFVIYVIARSRQLQQQPRNWLIFGQSISNFFGAIFLLTITFRINGNQFHVSVIPQTFLLYVKHSFSI